MNSRYSIEICSIEARLEHMEPSRRLGVSSTDSISNYLSPFSIQEMLHVTSMVVLHVVEWYIESECGTDVVKSSKSLPGLSRRPVKAAQICGTPLLSRVLMLSPPIFAGSFRFSKAQVEWLPTAASVDKWRW